MASNDDHAAVQTYQSLMVEAKARALSIDTLTRDQRGIPSPLIHEYGVLQIRMLCEIIGLGCLVAHGDLVKQSSHLVKKAYKPGEIFAELEKLHSDFFPVPMRPEKTEAGWHMADYTGGPYAAKSEIIKIWNSCGDILHRGSLKRLVKEQNPVQKDFSDLNQWGQKILNLLSNHRILRENRRQVIVTFLQVDDLSGTVQVVIAETPDAEPEGAA
ncbi:MAG: hypothetical protein ABI832_04880 [bacterium]